MDKLGGLAAGSLFPDLPQADHKPIPVAPFWLILKNKKAANHYSVFAVASCCSCKMQNTVNGVFNQAVTISAKNPTLIVFGPSESTVPGARTMEGRNWPKN